MEFNMDDIDQKLVDIEDSLSEWMADQLLHKNGEPLQVAAILMKNALVIYKTVLTEGDFDKTVDYIFKNTDAIRAVQKTILN